MMVVGIAKESIVLPDYKDFNDDGWNLKPTHSNRRFGFPLVETLWLKCSNCSVHLLPPLVHSRSGSFPPSSFPYRSRMSPWIYCRRSWCRWSSPAPISSGKFSSRFSSSLSFSDSFSLSSFKFCVRALLSDISKKVSPILFLDYPKIQNEWICHQWPIQRFTIPSRKG